MTIPTQAIVFPLCFLLAKRENGTLEQWSRRWARGGRTTFEMAFLYIFSSLLLVDWWILQWGNELPFDLMIHHGFCLAGHLLAAFSMPPGWPYYFAGSTALELASGVSNYYALQPSATVAVWYFWLMAVSNVVATWCMTYWVVAVKQPLGGRIFGAILTLVLVVLRQRDAYKVLQFEGLV